MKNFLQKGHQLETIAPSDVSSGDIVIAGELQGVAVNDAKSGKEVVLSLFGVYTLSCVASDVIAIGDKLYLKTDGGLTKTATNNKYAGVAFSPSPAAQDTVALRLPN